MDRIEWINHCIESNNRVIPILKDQNVKRRLERHVAELKLNVAKLIKQRNDQIKKKPCNVCL